MNIYCTIIDDNLTLIRLVEDLDQILRGNKNEYIEQGTVFISEGEHIELSIEEATFMKGWYISIVYNNSLEEFKNLLKLFVEQIESANFKYDLEYEIELSLAPRED